MNIKECLKAILVWADEAEKDEIFPNTLGAPFKYIISQTIAYIDAVETKIRHRNLQIKQLREDVRYWKRNCFAEQQENETAQQEVAKWKQDCYRLHKEVEQLSIELATGNNAKKLNDLLDYLQNCKIEKLPGEDPTQQDVTQSVIERVSEIKENA